MAEKRQTQIMEGFRDISGAVAQLTIEHYYIHKGQGYAGEYIAENVANGESRRLRITTTNKFAHVHLGINVTGKFNLSTYTAVTYTAEGETADGATLTQFNKVIGETNGDAVIRMNPVVENLGQLRATFII